MKTLQNVTNLLIRLIDSCSSWLQVYKTQHPSIPEWVTLRSSVNSSIDRLTLSRIAQEQSVKSFVNWVLMTQQLNPSPNVLHNVGCSGVEHWTLEWWRLVLWSDESCLPSWVWWLPGQPCFPDRVVKCKVWCWRDYNVGMAEFKLPPNSSSKGNA